MTFLEADTERQPTNKALHKGHVSLLKKKGHQKKTSDSSPLQSGRGPNKSLSWAESFWSAISII